MATYGTDAREGNHVDFSVDFNGTTNRWGGSDLISVSPLSNSGDTVSNKRKISDLSFSVYDSDGSIWDEMGHGTTAFGKSISLKVTIGGDYGPITSNNETTYGWLGTTGGQEFTVHNGGIVNITKKKKLITIRSENKLNKIKKLNWQMPVRTGGGSGEELISFFGSYTFYNLTASESLDHWNGTLVPNCLYDVSEDGFAGNLYAHNHAGVVQADFAGTGIYDNTGTGIQDFLADDFEFLDTKFHHQYPARKFKGTLFGTFKGTINTEDQAKSFGYADLIAAEADKTLGTEYEIDKIRLQYGTELNPLENEIYESQLIRLTGDPVAVLRHCLFGKMVSDYLDESTDMGDTFALSQKTIAFQVFDQTFHQDVASVEDQINDGLRMTSSIFFVSSNNQFEMSVYGPKDLTASIDFLGTNEVFESSYHNNVNDAYNRISLKYAWKFEDSSYIKEETGTLSDWSVIEDRPLEIESRWVKNDNQSGNFITKLLVRYKNTSPEITVTTGLNASGRDLGSLVSIEDPDSFEGTKIVQLIGYNKDFANTRKVTLRCLDGESLYRKNGYAKWEDSALASAVSGTSKSGWSNAIDLSAPSGTVNNINEDLYGTHFIYW